MFSVSPQYCTLCFLQVIRYTIFSETQEKLFFSLYTLPVLQLLNVVSLRGIYEQVIQFVVWHLMTLPAVAKFTERGVKKSFMVETVG